MWEWYQGTCLSSVPVQQEQPVGNGRRNINAVEVGNFKWIFHICSNELFRVSNLVLVAFFYSVTEVRTLSFEKFWKKTSHNFFSQSAWKFAWPVNFWFFDFRDWIHHRSLNQRNISVLTYMSFFFLFKSVLFGL